MQISPQLDQQLHSKLPIDKDEKVLAVYKHHWFAYASSWVAGIVIVLLIMGAAIGLSMLLGNNSESSLAGHQTQIIGIAGFLCVLVLIGTSIPVYLRSQEQLVLTEEALLQVLQPSMFSNKIDQLSLQHITDVSVRQDFFGTMFGFGHITMETPGEQDNYEFYVLPNPHDTAREIIEAHENFDAALQGGHLSTTLGNGTMPQAPQIDPQQYQQFLQYQQMVAQQQKQQAQATPSAPAEQPESQPQDPTNQA